MGVKTKWPPKPRWPPKVKWAPIIIGTPLMTQILFFLLEIPIVIFLNYMGKCFTMAAKTKMAAKFKMAT